MWLEGSKVKSYVPEMPSNNSSNKVRIRPANATKILLTPEFELSAAGCKQRSVLSTISALQTNEFVEIFEEKSRKPYIFSKFGAHSLTARLDKRGDAWMPDPCCAQTRLTSTFGERRRGRRDSVLDRLLIKRKSVLSASPQIF